MLPRRLSTGQSYTPIGAKTSKINLLRPTGRRDALGDPLPPDVFASGIWARIQTLTSKYTEKKEQVVSESTHKITIGFMDGVTSGMLVQDVVSGAIYEIEGSPNDPDGRRVELWLMCYLRNDGRNPIQAG